MYITKINLEIDEVTGLQKELRIVNFTVDAEIKIITVTYVIVLVSPTGVVMVELERNQFTRYNGVVKNRYNDLQNSPIGIGIIQMLDMDLATYPDFKQE